MQLGHVVGHATATIKHPSLKGWRLLVVQLLGATGQPDGEPVLAIDSLGAGAGMDVIVTNDGRGVQELLGTRATPIRWMTLGISDG
jgi:ethanolamine utilization protein EutN